MVHDKNTTVLYTELKAFTEELERLNHQARLFGVNAAVEAVKQEDEMRRAMETVARGVDELTGCCDSFLSRARVHLSRIEAVLPPDSAAQEQGHHK